MEGDSTEKKVIEIKKELDKKDQAKMGESTAVKVEDSTQKDESVNEELKFSHLLKHEFITGYTLHNSLRMIVIKPFKLNLFTEIAAKIWFEQCSEYVVRLSKNGESIAVLQYSSEETGESALIDLNESLVSKYPDVQIYHPFQPYTYTRFSSIDGVVSDLTVAPQSIREHHGGAFNRQMVLEGIPDDMTTQQIAEIFPEAFNILDFRELPTAKGIMTFEVEDLDKMEKILALQIQIGNATVSINRLTKRVHKWTRDRKRVIGTKKERTKECMPDEERIDIAKRYLKHEHFMSELLNRKDIYHHEKKKEFQSLCESKHELYDQLAADTYRRREAGITQMPESEEYPCPFVFNILNLASLSKPSMSLDSPSKVPNDPGQVHRNLPGPEMKDIIENAKKEMEERNRKATEALRKQAAAEQHLEAPMDGANERAWRGRGSQRGANPLLRGGARGRANLRSRGQPSQFARGTTNRGSRGAGQNITRKANLNSRGGANLKFRGGANFNSQRGGRRGDNQNVRGGAHQNYRSDSNVHESNPSSTGPHKRPFRGAFNQNYRGAGNILRGGGRGNPRGGANPNFRGSILPTPPPSMHGQAFQEDYEPYPKQKRISGTFYQ